MQYYSINEIKSWGRFYRGNFINSLQGFKAGVIGTVNEQGQRTLAILVISYILAPDPALIGFINRPIEAAPL